MHGVDSPSYQQNGVDSPSYQSTYQPLSPRQTDDTHMYGDQGMIYTEPMAGRGTYQPPTNRPIKSSHAVQSPVYNQFNHGDIINGNKQPLQAKTSSTYMELDHAINPDNHHKYGTISTGINPENTQSSNQPIRSSVTSTLKQNYLTSPILLHLIAFQEFLSKEFSARLNNHEHVLFTGRRQLSAL